MERKENDANGHLASEPSSQQDILGKNYYYFGISFLPVSYTKFSLKSVNYLKCGNPKNKIPLDVTI